MHDHSHAHRELPAEALAEKNRVALISVYAAVLLTGGKIGIGWWTGSLGILAEAIHSGLDLAAAFVTLLAVRAAGKPADERHAYGHGKIENLSALFETLLLLVTCMWIIKEAVGRLIGFEPVHVQVNLWSFLVVIVSILVDFSRSRALLRVARKYQSQALEADALHFATDIWSSLVVLVGLIGVILAQRLRLPWLVNADAVSALGVAGMVIWVSLKLGKKSIDDLLDTVPTDLHKNIGDTAKVPGVCDVQNVRVRRSGPELFVDLTLLVPHQESLQRSHAIASSAEQAIRHEFPNADVVVHVEPSDNEGENLLETAKRIAAQHGASAHNLVVHEESGRWILELHVEMPGELPLAMAHDQASHIEEDIAQALPSLARVSIHIEPEGGRRQASHASREEIQRIEAVLQEAMDSEGRGDAARDMEIRRCESDFSICFTCSLPAQLSVNETHVFTEKVERFLRTRLPDLDRVLIRTEPRS